MNMKHDFIVCACVFFYVLFPNMSNNTFQSLQSNKKKIINIMSDEISAIIQYMTVSGHPQQQLQFISMSLLFSQKFQSEFKRNIFNFICDEVSVRQKSVKILYSICPPPPYSSTHKHMLHGTFRGLVQHVSYESSLGHLEIVGSCM